jgi:hypothetical protein
MSTYILLTIVWSETYQQSRNHWFSQETFRRQWMFAYLVFNCILYGGQLLFYLYLFILDDNTEVFSTISDMIYGLLVLNFVLPAVTAGAWIFLIINLSGFPMKVGGWASGWAGSMRCGCWCWCWTVHDAASMLEGPS